MVNSGEPDSFGSLLRSHRLRHRLTQETLSERTGISVRSIGGLEQGTGRGPRPSTLIRLADAFRLRSPERDEFVSAGERAFWASRPGRVLPSGPPAQLPRQVHGFTGRIVELETLAFIAQDRSCPPLVIVSGMAGVGKTALAVHWAHRVASGFADGQLYADLRGFDSAAQPLDPSSVLRGFLAALGLPRQHVPADLDARAARYRSLLTGRRVLILLDNARDADQVRPLLPGSPGCLAVVTSRHQLTSLVAAEGAHHIALGMLTADESRLLLVLRLGQARVSAEPDAVDAIVARCSGLPLALAVVAAAAATRPQRPLAGFVADLDELGALDLLADESRRTDLRAVLASSYRALDAEPARLFRLLGVQPGPVASDTAVASLAGSSVHRVRRDTAVLVRAHLLAEDSAGRFVMHDLLRAYAAELADAQESGSDRQDALRRVLDHYLHTAHGAMAVLYPSRDPVDVGVTDPAVTCARTTDPQRAHAWLTAEHDNLVTAITAAARAGLATHTLYLSTVLAEYLFRTGHWQESIDTLQIGNEAARRSGDRQWQANCRRWLARSEAALGRYDAALAQLDRAAGLFAELGDAAGLANTHRTLAQLCEQRGDHQHALHHARQALDFNRQADRPAGEAAGLNLVGWYHSLLGDHQEGLAWCTQAVEKFRALGNAHGEAAALDSVGYAYHHLGHWAAATESYLRAVELCRRIGHRDLEVEVLGHLADTHLAIGSRRDARQALQQALEILQEQRHPSATKVAAQLRAVRLARTPTPAPQRTRDGRTTTQVTARASPRRSDTGSAEASPPPPPLAS